MSRPAVACAPFFPAPPCKKAPPWPPGPWPLAPGPPARGRAACMRVCVRMRTRARICVYVRTCVYARAQTRIHITRPTMRAEQSPRHHGPNKRVYSGTHSDASGHDSRPPMRPPGRRARRVFCQLLRVARKAAEIRRFFTVGVTCPDFYPD